MFEIWGDTSNLKGDKLIRLNKYLTNTENHKNIVFFPPSYPLWKDYLKKVDVAVLTFKYFTYQNSPYVTLSMLNDALNDFVEFKDKILVAISPMGFDYNLDKEINIPITNNRATLKANVKGAKVYYSEEIGAPYFTYSAPDTHLIWFENTLSIATKHNLIKKYGYRGIYYEHPEGFFEGNWEALYEIYEKRNSL